jgi:hypothetical protein
VQNLGFCTLCYNNKLIEAYLQKQLYDMKNITLTKSIAHLFLCLLAIVSISAMVSCTDTTDDNGSSSTIDKKLLYGTWKITSATLNGTDVTSNMQNTTITFFTNGTYLPNGGDTAAFSLSGNKLTFNDGTDEAFVLTISSLTSTTMIASGTGSPGDSPSGSWTMTLTKVNSPDEENINMSLIYGSWVSTSHVINGVTTTTPTIGLSFNHDGTGMLSDNGVTENNGYNFTISGNTIIVKPIHVQEEVSFTYTITALTSNSAVITGNYMPGSDSEISYIGYYTKVSK